MLARQPAASRVSSPTTWPAVLLLGLVVVAVLALQLRLPAETRSQVEGGVLWLAIFLADALVSNARLPTSEKKGVGTRCECLRVRGPVIYTGKLLFNFVTIGLIAGVLIPLFAILCDTQLLRHPIAILVVTLIAAWGLAAAGTLIGALTGLKGRETY